MLFYYKKIEMKIISIFSEIEAFSSDNFDNDNLYNDNAKYKDVVVSRAVASDTSGPGFESCYKKFCRTLNRKE